MKIAIFHDYFDEIGGAEITLLHLAKELGATIFTTNIDKEAINRLGFYDIKIKSIGRVPKIRHIKQLLAQIKFSSFKLKTYDFFIFGGSYSIYASKNHKPNIWYCFSPLRGIYDLRYINYSKYNLLIQIIKEIQIKFDKKAIKNIDKIIAPSLNIKKRVRKYYDRKSVLIYSPVETSIFEHKFEKGYWLNITRIDHYKRLEILLKTFKKLKNEKLIVVGKASRENEKYFRKLRKLRPSNVIFKEAVYHRQEIKELYSNCKGLITTAMNEDFGMSPVEAMASGKPVIACNEGGYKETVINGKTGILIDNINEEKLAGEIKKMSKELKKNPNKYKSACQKQAKKFDVKIFIKKIKEEIKEMFKN